MPKLRLVKKRRMFLAGVRKYGTVRAGVARAKVERSEAMEWIEDHPDFRKRYEDALRDFQDSVEERLLRLADKGDGSCLRFKLRGEAPHKYGPRPVSAFSAPPSASSLAPPISPLCKRRGAGGEVSPVHGIDGDSGSSAPSDGFWEESRRLAAERLANAGVPAPPPASADGGG